MTDYSDLIKQLSRLETEQINPDTVDIDNLPSLEVCRRINAEDKKVAAVVERALPALSRAAEIFADTLRNQARVFYLGAGTSGRLGVLDAAECPPTFGTDPTRIVGLIAGGHASLVVSREGVEDDCEAAANDLREHGLARNDFVVGICASRRTPYTLAGLKYAASVGSRTAIIICNTAADLAVEPDVVIELPVGPEAIAGSTRMKSGTAQKMALNIMSTTAMVLLGKTYGNLMIDLQARSDKLAARSRKILIDLFGLTLDQAGSLLETAQGSVKLALVMHSLKCSREMAIEKLRAVGGFCSKVK